MNQCHATVVVMTAYVITPEAKHPFYQIYRINAGLNDVKHIKYRRRKI